MMFEMDKETLLPRPGDGMKDSEIIKMSCEDIVATFNINDTPTDTNGKLYISKIATEIDKILMLYNKGMIDQAVIRYEYMKNYFMMACDANQIDMEISMLNSYNRQSQRKGRKFFEEFTDVRPIVDTIKIQLKEACTMFYTKTLDTYSEILIYILFLINHGNSIHK